MSIAYEFKHPNHGWQGIQAECDARNFQLLMGWEVRSNNQHIWEPDFPLFSLVTDFYDKTLLEVVGNPFFDIDSGEKNIHVKRPDEEESVAELVALLSPVDCKVVKTCPSSDPAAMTMPLKAAKGDIWMFPVPEEVFSLKGVYVRLFVPHNLVR